MNPESLFLLKLIPPSGQEVLTTCLCLAPATAMLAYFKGLPIQLVIHYRSQHSLGYSVSPLVCLPFHLSLLTFGLQWSSGYLGGNEEFFLLLVSLLAVWPRKIIVSSHVFSLLLLQSPHLTTNMGILVIPLNLSQWDFYKDKSR